MTSFADYALRGELLDGMNALGFSAPTDIQQASLPLVLSGKDVLAQAKTGSGKTVAFALGLLQDLDTTRFETQALVMCPTRELAEQVAEEIRRIGKLISNMKVLTLCGGAPMGPQIQSLKHGAHVVVGTPGRIMDHLLKRRLQLSQVACLVLDEADRMLDMGFEEEMAVVTEHVPVERQTLLFSATYPEQIQQISARYQRNPKRVEVEATHDTHKIEQLFYEVEPDHKVKACAALLTEYQPASAIIFCNRKKGCQETQDALQEMGFVVAALHGDLEQRARTQMLTQFANQSAPVLVATDVAARGLDVKGVDLVINLDVSEDAEVHIHRIGRTGRADQTGKALTLCAPQEARFATAIEEYQQQSLRWKGIQSVRFHANRIQPPVYQTVCVDGGKKNKLSPGDILGALTKDAGIDGGDIGKIKVTAIHTYIAIKTRSVKRTLAHFREGRIKGRKYKARKLTP